MDIFTTDARTADLNQLGDEIAELSAHLEAAIARLLDLIREFDAREGWGNGFRSCAAWLSFCFWMDLSMLSAKFSGFDVNQDLNSSPQLNGIGSGIEFFALCAAVLWS